MVERNESATPSGTADAPRASTGQQPAPQLHVDDSQVAALYANFCCVTGTPEELIIDFGLSPPPMGVPTEPPCAVVDPWRHGNGRRVIMGPFLATPARSRRMGMPMKKRFLMPLLSMLATFLPIVLHAAEPIGAFTSGARILFQGDSITDGNRGRSVDPNHILGHGYVFIIAAKYGAAFPDLRLDFVNRGVSGNTVLDLEKRWQKDTLDLKPDVLSILIGVNDNGRGVPLDQYEKVYEKLITDAKAANPKLKLVLCAPFVKPTGTINEGIRKRQEIVAKLAQKHGAALVQFQPVFDEAAKRAPADYWVWDNVHPTYRGHQLMADEWERVVREFWK